MSKPKKEKTEDIANKPMIHSDHAKPKTRRDFLASGLISAGSYLAMPSLLAMLRSQSAQALECSEGGSASGVPGVLCFDLAGGASIAGSNVMVGKQGGQEDFLADYRTLGLPSDIARNVNRELGLVFHDDSAFLRGILETTTPETRANIEGAVFCTSSADDTGNNPLNPMYWLNAAGAKGELAQLVGSRNSESGGSSRVPSASVNPAARPVLITRPQDALNLVQLGKLANLVGADKAQKVLKTIEAMSSQQLAKFSNKDLPAQIKDLIKCGYINSADMLNKFTPERLDARNDQEVLAAFDNLNNNGQSQVATMAKLLIDGNTGAATVERGGYDYHDGSRSTGEVKDFEAGRLMGQALQLAALKQRDLIVYAFSDGSVTSSGGVDNSGNGRGKLVWTADSGQRGAAFMLYYRAAGKPKLRDSSVRQVGSFKDNGAVDNAASQISSNVENLGKAVAANLLAIQGREGELASVVGDNPFGSNLNRYLIFDKQD